MITIYLRFSNLVILKLFILISLLKRRLQKIFIVFFERMLVK